MRILVAIEAEQIIGDLVSRASAAGIASALLSAAFSHLMIYENRITGQR